MWSVRTTKPWAIENGRTGEIRTRDSSVQYLHIGNLYVTISYVKNDWIYRVYFRKEREILLLLLGGSNKKGQQKAISAAKLAWKKYESDRKQSAQKEKRINNAIN